MEERKIKKRKEKALADGNKENAYFSCKDLGDMYLHSEDYEAALCEYKEAERFAKSLSNNVYFGVINRMIGETYCFMGDFERAIKHQRVHLELSQKENNLVEEQRALATLGRTYFVKAESVTAQTDEEKKTDLSYSRRYYTESLEICEQLDGAVSGKQLSEMKSRLYLNLGLTSESQGDINDAINYIEKAIEISKNMDLWEDLYKCYACKGSLLIRCNSISKAISTLELAINAAELLPNKALHICEALSLKANAFLKMSDHFSAKQALIQAYKMKSPDETERRAIEKKLRIAVVMCEKVSSLMELKEDYDALRKHNEILGDCCVALKLYTQAIKYYHNMLQWSKRLGMKGRDLIPAYVSLAQTYRDNKQYDLSIKYFRKELQHYNDNPTEASRTLLNIADTMELQLQDYKEILKEYKDAREMALKSGDKKMEGIILNRMIAMLKDNKQYDLAEEMEKELESVGCYAESPVTDENSDYEEDELTADIGDDIDLSELPDIVESTNTKEVNRSSLTRRKVKPTIRRNEKGETPLHIACAKGNVQLVKSLIKQGYPLNSKDAVGWLPIHEGCNHGHLSIVKTLIEAGADVNERGGAGCDGVTALHDAAAAGQLDIIEYLLDNGASILARTNKGETALDCLLACRERVVREQGEELDGSTLAHFTAIVERFRDAFRKAGYNAPKPKDVVIQTKRRNSDPLDDFELNYTNRRLNVNFNEDVVSGPAEDYQNTIQAMRLANRQASNILVECPKPSKTISAFFNEEDVGDDWLERDIVVEKRTVKRKCEEFVGQQLRTKRVGDLSLSTKTHTQINDEKIVNNMDNYEVEEEDVSEVRPWISHEFSTQKSKVKTQKSLLSLGVERVQVESSPIKAPKAKETGWGRSVKVSVEGKLFYVPIPDNREELNMKWLINETSRRYHNSEGVKPSLKICTIDGALLDDNDPISIIADKGEIRANVISWDLSPLPERYRDACKVGNINVDKYIESQLEMCEATCNLCIEDCPVKSAMFSPLIKSISHQYTLQHISLAGSSITDVTFKMILDGIMKLPSIRSLNVNTNNITSEGIAHLSCILNEFGPFQALECLDLSYNPLGGKSLAHLSKILPKLPNLKTLNLQTIDIVITNFDTTMPLDNIEDLDISYNELGREGAAMFLGGLDASKVRSLKLSNCGGSGVFRECLLFLERGYVDNLTQLDLSNLDLDDSDVESIVRCLQNAYRISILNLSCNRNVTIKSHKFISELTCLKEIDLSGCQALSSSHEIIFPCTLTIASINCNEYAFQKCPYNTITNKLL